MSMQAPPTTTAPLMTPSSKSKPKKSKEKARKEKASPPNERLKIIVRRLPPNLPEEIFWQSVANWVTDETVTWKAYAPGKPRKRLNKENVPSRAYIAFKKPEQVIVFSREYDGHLFRDKAGNEFQAIVEFAPYQKIPSEKKKPDARHATIEKDEDYISFVNSLNATSNAEPVSLETLLASTRPPSPPKTTPLLEALKAEKQAQKDKEAIIRHHPHYKDLSIASSASTSVPAPTILSKKEEKRKGGASANISAKTETAPSGGKKGKKAVQQAAKQIQIQTKHSALATSAASSGRAPSPSAGPSQPPPKPHGTSSRGGKKHGRYAPAQSAASIPPIPPGDEANVNTPIVKPREFPSGVASITNAPSSPTSITTTATVAVGAASTSQPRRPRPVLGLGSRQFEAALSSVVGATPGGERRSRREKEREKEKEMSTATTTAKDANTSNTNTQQEMPAQEKPSPTSPKRQRHRRMTNERSQAAAAASNGGAEAGASALSRPVDSGAALAGNAQSVNVIEPQAPSRGGSRRGRGGRGRGFLPRVG